MSEQAISRVLFPQAVTCSGTMAIHLVSTLPWRSSDLPGNSGGPPSSVPLFGLAPGGVCLAPVVTDGTGELLPHPFTLTPPHIYDRTWGGFLSVALSCPLPGLGVTQHPVLRSPDFPLPCKKQSSGHLSCSDTLSF